MGILTFEGAERIAKKVNEALEISQGVPYGTECTPQTVEAMTGDVRFVPRIAAESFGQLDGIVAAAGRHGLSGVFDGIEAVVGSGGNEKIVSLFTLPQGSLNSFLAHGDL